MLITALCVALSSCSSSPEPEQPPPPPPAEGMLAGWKLTLPEADEKGDAASIEPATLADPWLTDAGGSLAFWSPVEGATTKNSDHARTELVALDGFAAGREARALRASVVVSQVPAAGQDVIVGQVHGDEDIKSVAFVMLHWEAGDITVVVKKKQKGDDADRLTLLPDVPLGARFDFGIRDNGNGTMTLTASEGARTASQDVPVPEDFDDATVRFQAGAYQQSDTDKKSDSDSESDADAAGGGDATAAPEDGARVTFYSLTTGT